MSETSIIPLFWKDKVKGSQLHQSSNDKIRKGTSDHFGLFADVYKVKPKEFMKQK